jgi:enterochelin esterase-like enzyme
MSHHYEEENDEPVVATKICKDCGLPLAKNCKSWLFSKELTCASKPSDRENLCYERQISQLNNQNETLREELKEAREKIDYLEYKMDFYMEYTDC